jgi:hypothetical protein
MIANSIVILSINTQSMGTYYRDRAVDDRRGFDFSDLLEGIIANFGEWPALEF